MGGEVRGSASKDRKAGVLTLIRKNSPYKVKSVDRDREGRWVAITIQPNNAPQHTTYTITDLYAPNSPTKDYFQALTTWILQDPQ